MKGREIVAALFGFVMLIALAFSGYRMYRFFFPRVDVLVSLSLEWREPQGLAILGRAVVEGKAAPDGRVRLKVQRFTPSVDQVTLLEEIKNGEFLVSPSGFLASVRERDGIAVTAEVQVPDKKGTLEGREYAYRNVSRWLIWKRWIPWVLVPGCAVLAILLSVLFTGDFTPRKNRIAISISYTAIAFFLLAPLVAPFFLNIVPEVKNAMERSPVGLLPVGQTNGIDLNQWALNIGGIPIGPNGDGSFTLKGGLVIPLYVLILATLGGAINMTRKVPRLQADMDARITVPAGALGIGRGITSAATELISGAFQVPNRPQAEGDQAGAKTSGQTPRPEEGRAKRQTLINQLREDLINQYMYFFTAPFLAVVTFYMLYLIDPNLANRTPIVVLVSFSAGLISESVLRTITGYADKYLHRLLESLKPDKEDKRKAEEEAKRKAQEAAKKSAEAEPGKKQD